LFDVVDYHLRCYKDQARAGNKQIPRAAALSAKLASVVTLEPKRLPTVVDECLQPARIAVVQFSPRVVYCWREPAYGSEDVGAPPKIVTRFKVTVERHNLSLSISVYREVEWRRHTIAARAVRSNSELVALAENLDEGSNSLHSVVRGNTLLTKG
jgi:hypothetical protein